jgi:lipopolysaccharide transport system ATP-binding protein
MSDWSIKVENLSKLYRIGLKEQRHETLVGAGLDFLRSPAKNLRQLRGLTNFTDANADSEDVIWALRDVSFKVPAGEVLGIIGANGAGKSTLLKILSEITEPTTGRALVKGRVASLLEVGTGFHPELTGRENTYLNGTILGMTKVEVDRKFDEIVAFSGVEKFIDTPVKRFSSGMRVRLAFAVAAHLEPEILLIDEVLAVGDAQFQKKCIGKMGEVAEGGRTVLFVSHNMVAVKTLCKSTVWLDQGRIRESGEPLEVVTTYLEGGLRRETESSWSPDEAPASDEIRLLGARVRPVEGDRIFMGEPFDLEFEFEKLTPGDCLLDVTFHLTDEMGVLVFVGSTIHDCVDTTMGRGLIRAVARVPGKIMNEGVYAVSRFLVVRGKASLMFDRRDLLGFEIVNPGENRWGWMGAKKEGVVRPSLSWSIEGNLSSENR